MTATTAAPIANPFGVRFVAPLALASTMNPINSSLISTALVPIAQYFHASVADTGWMIAGLYLASAVAQPTMGRLADIFGPRRVLLSALLLVALAGILGAFAQTLPVLIATRVMIGIGTSGAYPAAMRMFRTRGEQSGSPPPRTAMGVLSLSALSVSAIGPFLGGVLTAAFGWHAVFAVNLPIALIAMGLVFAWAPPDQAAPGDARRLWSELDVAGIALFALTLLSLMLFLMNLSHPQWPALGLAVAFGIGLTFWSLRRPDPFIDVRMLAANRPLTFTYIRVGAILIIGYCMFYGFSQWLQSAGGVPSSIAGLVTLPMSIVAAAGSFLAARLRSIRTAFLIATGGALLGSIALFMLDHTAPLWLIGSALALFGLPLGMTSTATQASVYIQAPPDKIGTAAGLQRTAIYLGSILSASLLGLVFGQQATDAGFHTLMLVLGILSAILVVAVLVDRTIPTQQSSSPT